MAKYKNPWFVFLCWLIGVPLFLYIFMWGALLSMSGGADMFWFFVFVFAVIFCAYKAFKQHKKNKAVPKNDN